MIEDKTAKFIKEAKKVHGDKYDYSKVKYTRSDRKVCITCPIHGEFWQTPTAHNYYGYGCPKCGIESKKKLIFGVGTNDLLGESASKACMVWSDMLRRCYTKEMQAKFPSYIGCSVCEEWKRLSNFKVWFDINYIEGWQLDKDIIVKNNKIYSPETCCFVPNDINTVIIKPVKSKCIYRGVSFDKVNNKYRASITMYGKPNNLGRYKTPEEAFNVYKKVKERHIKELADMHKELLPPHVYKALYDYKIEITD
jgi:hypothetical protein